MSHLKVPIALMVCALALFASTARADEERVRGGPCKADRERLCADVPHARGAVVRCLRLHDSELSDACRTFLNQRGRRGHPPPQPEPAN